MDQLSAGVRKRFKLSAHMKDLMTYIVLVLPLLVLLFSTIFYPIIKSAYMSLFSVNLLRLNERIWNNFQNYKSIFSDGEFFHSFYLSNKFAFIVVSLQLIIGLSLAFILNEKIFGRKLLRSLLLIPWIIPTVITALLWLWIFQPDYGVLNYLLVRVLKVTLEPIKWVGDINTALIAVAVVALWKQLPFMTTMLIAGMQSIPEEIYEAAAIDGANNTQVKLYITIPFLQNVIKSTALVAIIENFKMFPLFWIMTQGGPLNSTTTLAVLTYHTSFVGMEMGKGAAIGVLWTSILILFSIVYNRIFRSLEKY